MNPIKSLEETLQKKRKTLSERQTYHLNACIAYLKALKKDFTSAKKEYEAEMKKHKDH